MQLELYFLGTQCVFINIQQFQLMSQKAPSTQKTITTKQLWQNSYPTSKMLFELTYMIITLALWAWHLYRSVQVKQNPVSVVIGFFVGLLTVDFISGLAHWACDTWGTFYTPIFGPTLIRAFRMHHVDPQDITRHGFIETNASTCYPAPPWLIAGLLMTPGSCMGVQIFHWMINFGVIATIFTNQIHKWSHMVHSRPSLAVRFLQTTGFILSHDHHHRHHQGQFDNSYCIINGWMNPFLEYVDFWRRTQRLITWATGAQPRADDAFWRSIKKDLY